MRNPFTVFVPNFAEKKFLLQILLKNEKKFDSNFEIEDLLQNISSQTRKDYEN